MTYKRKTAKRRYVRDKEGKFARTSKGQSATIGKIRWGSQSSKWNPQPVKKGSKRKKTFTTTTDHRGRLIGTGTGNRGRVYSKKTQAKAKKRKR